MIVGIIRPEFAGSDWLSPLDVETKRLMDLVNDAIRKSKPRDRVYVYFDAWAGILVDASRSRDEVIEDIRNLCVLSGWRATASKEGACIVLRLDLSPL